LVEFVRKHNFQVLNVAGPRASEDSEAGPFASRVLEEMMKIPDEPEQKHQH
jgi:hypothetical protein